jgi:hypothetical protein
MVHPRRSSSTARSSPPPANPVPPPPTSTPSLPPSIFPSSMSISRGGALGRGRLGSLAL